MYALARWTMPVGRFAACVGALLFMLTPRLAANLVGDMGYAAGLCWAPLALACLRAALERASLRWAVAAGVSGAMLFTLNFVIFLYLGLFAAAYTLLLAVQRRSGRALLRLAGVCALLGVVLLGAAAFQIVPLATYLPYQSRQALTLAENDYLALPPALLLEALYPNALRFPEWTFHVGLLALPLALLAARHPVRREALLWGVMLLFAIAFALGTSTPLYALIVEYVPGFALMRAPSRMLLFAALALAALAALGVDAWLRRGFRLGASWLAGALLLAMSSVAARVVTVRPGEVDWLLGGVAAAALLGGVATLMKRPAASRALLALAVIAELFPLAASYMQHIDFASIVPTPAVAAPIVADRTRGDVFRIYGVGRELPDHLLAGYRLQSAEGLNSFQFTHYADYMRVASGCPLTGVTAAVPVCASTEVAADAAALVRPHAALLGALNVRYLTAPAALPNDTSDLQLVFQRDGRWLYRNHAEMPRAYVVFDVRAGDTAEALLAQPAPGLAGATMPRDTSPLNSCRRGRAATSCTSPCLRRACSSSARHGYLAGRPG
jgi:hypothetical protein